MPWVYQCNLPHNNDFASSFLAAVNLGGDTDTVAAVAGGLVGIAYGLEAIPAEWMDVLVKRNEILSLANDFADRLMQSRDSCGSLPDVQKKKLYKYNNFGRMYWVDPGRLLAGGYPGDFEAEKASEKLSFLVNSGIRQVVNLMEADEANHSKQSFIPYEDELQELDRQAGSDIKICRLSIEDMSVHSKAEMKQILNIIDQILEDDCPVYVHCWGGLGRTGTVAGCYLVRHDLVRGKEALGYLNDLRRDTTNRDKPSP